MTSERPERWFSHVKLKGMKPNRPPTPMESWIRLANEPGVGPVMARTILDQFNDAHAFYLATPDALRARLPAQVAQRALRPCAPELANIIDQTLCWAAKPGHHLVTFSDPAYPPRLRQMTDAPVMLFAQGDLTILLREAIAIVGARRATPDGLDNAYAFAGYMARQGWCVVSGLADGIDGAAHQGALAAGLQGGGTIAVLGTGMDNMYPKSHAGLATEIVDKGGLLVSELPLGSPVLPKNFPSRNRIVAGLTRGVLVVEATLRSGSLITARLAVEMGREVFAIPGSIHSPLTRGTHSLIQQGAKLVECGQDILSEFGSVAVKTAEPRARAGTAPRSPVWRAIGYDPVSAQVLQSRTGLPPETVQLELIALEMAGSIDRREGGCVARPRPPR